TALRFLPRLAGALVPVLTYACWLALGIGRRAAFLAACMILLDNAFLVQSRFVLLDSVLLFFGFAGLCLFLQARRRGYQLARLLPAAALFGFSTSVKWTGISFLSLALAITAADLYLGVRRRRTGIRRTTTNLMILAVAPILVYLAVFWIHFSLLTQ